MSIFKMFCLIFRVQYAPENLSLIQNLLNANPTAIHRLNRAHLLNDLFVLSSFSSVLPTSLSTSYEDAFQTSLYLKDEEDYIPFSTAIRYARKIVGLTQINWAWNFAEKQLPLLSENGLNLSVASKFPPPLKTFNVTSGAWSRSALMTWALRTDPGTPSSQKGWGEN